MIPNDKLLQGTKLRTVKVNDIWSEELFSAHHSDYKWPGVLPQDTAQYLPYQTVAGEKLGDLPLDSILTVEAILYEAAKTFVTDQNPTGAAFQCIRAMAMLADGSGAQREVMGFVYTTHLGVDYAELYEQPGGGFALEIAAGQLTIAQATVADGKLTEYSERKEPLPIMTGGAGGGVGTAGSEASDKSSAPAVAAPEEWRPDVLVDYHMGKFTVIGASKDPRVLIDNPSTESGESFWPLGQGGWILLGFTHGFPAGQAFSIEYQESSQSNKAQNVDIWIAKASKVDALTPVPYLIRERSNDPVTTGAVYFSSIGDRTANYVNIPPQIVWPGPPWRYVGKTEINGEIHRGQLPLEIEPGLYHYILLRDCLEHTNSEESNLVGGSDAKSIRVIQSSKVHFILLIDGSRSMFIGKPELRTEIEMCVKRVKTFSCHGEKRMTAFFIRGDIETFEPIRYDVEALGNALPGDIMERLMGVVDEGWKNHSSNKTPLAETIEKATAYAKGLPQGEVAALMIVSDGIYDPGGNLNTPEQVRDDVNTHSSKVIGAIASDDGAVRKALEGLKEIKMAFAIRIVGPWLKMKLDDTDVGNKIKEAFETITSVPLEIVDGLSADTTETINHTAVFHTDCKIPGPTLTRCPAGAAKRLIRIYGRYQGGELSLQQVQLTPLPIDWDTQTQEKVEKVDDYPKVLDRDVFWSGGNSGRGARASCAAEFELQPTDKAPRKWKMTRCADIESNWKWKSLEATDQKLYTIDKFGCWKFDDRGSQ